MNCLRGPGRCRGWRSWRRRPRCTIERRHRRRSSGDLDSDYDYSVRVLGDQPEDRQPPLRAGFVDEQQLRAPAALQPPVPWETIDDGSRRAGPHGPGSIFAVSSQPPDRGSRARVTPRSSPTLLAMDPRGEPDKRARRQTNPWTFSLSLMGTEASGVRLRQPNLVPYLLNSIESPTRLTRRSR